VSQHYVAIRTLPGSAAHRGDDFGLRLSPKRCRDNCVALMSLAQRLDESFSTMTTTSPSHVPFAELAVEARVLLFIIALPAVARFGVNPPEQSELTPVLETIWNRNRLCPNDLSDPFHMSALLKKELASVSRARTAQRTQERLLQSDSPRPSATSFVALGVRASVSKHT
jgi:hypothetical protein